MTSRQRQVNQNHALCQFIVDKLVENPNWAREIKIAKQLIQEYPDKEFWCKAHIGKKFSSLSFFLTETGKRTLRICQRREGFTPETPVTYELQTELIGESKVVDMKPKSLMEFLKKKY